MRLLSLLYACSLLVATALTGHAQESPFSPRVLVNNRAITHYELEQRVLFLKILRTPGDLEEEALARLIEDRLRLDAAAAMDIDLTDEELQAGMTEFAGRAQLTLEEFLQAIGGGGVEPQTFRDFVSAGLVWREVVRAKFAARADVTESDIDRALALSSQRGAVRVLLSEIILPATPETVAQSEALAERLSATIRSEAAFAAAAREYSASPSREQGGRIDWLPLGNLPAQFGPLILALAPGEVSDPIAVPGAIALFQLRAIEVSQDLQGDAVALDFAQFLIAGGRSPEALAEAARIRADVDTCDDLYGTAFGLPAEQLRREVLPMSQIPADIGLELAKLDEGESSVALTRGNALVFLMLCERRLATAEPPSRDNVRQQLFNQQLNGYSEAYLAELVAGAAIVTP